MTDAELYACMSDYLAIMEFALSESTDRAGLGAMEIKNRIERVRAYLATFKIEKPAPEITVPRSTLVSET